MKKEKRKLYRIAEMRRSGLNYIQRDIEIQKIKRALDFANRYQVPWWQKFWNFIKKVLRLFKDRIMILLNRDR